MKKVVLILKLIMKLFFSGINSIPNISGIYNLRSINAVSGNGQKIIIIIWISVEYNFVNTFILILFSQIYIWSHNILRYTAGVSSSPLLYQWLTNARTTFRTFTFLHSLILTTFVKCLHLGGDSSQTPVPSVLLPLVNQLSPSFSLPGILRVSIPLPWFPSPFLLLSRCH